MHVAIKNYKNNVKSLKELKELEFLRELELNKIKNAAKIKLNDLNQEISDILEDLEFELKHRALKKRHFKRQNSHEDEIKF